MGPATNQTLRTSAHALGVAAPVLFSFVAPKDLHISPEAWIPWNLILNASISTDLMAFLRPRRRLCGVELPPGFFGMPQCRQGQPVRSVLDPACGDGEFLNACAGRGLVLRGCDLRARSPHLSGEVQFQQGPFQQAAFEHGHDLIWISNLLEHLQP